MLELLTFTSLYPNAVQPQYGVFVEQRLRQLLAGGEVTSRVIAPVPWFPVGAACFGRYGALARVPRRERRHGIDVTHPRYPVVPKVGTTAAPLLMALGVRSEVRRALAAGPDFRAIDAHYFYPDGVAAVLLGHRLHRPVVVTARGSDINVLATHRGPRAQIRWAIRHAAAVVAVSEALRRRLLELGAPEERVVVLRNGVDLAMFRPLEAQRSRAARDREGPILLSVGQLIESKGHDLAIRALPDLPDVRLLVVGEGRLAEPLRRLAATLGVDGRVEFVGGVAQERLAELYGGADALVLASSREGMPNVVLEALACGTPVIATRVGGVPEVVVAPEAGVLMERRDPRALVDAYHELMRRYPDRTATRRVAERFDWGATTRGQVELFRRIVTDGTPRSRATVDQNCRK